MDSIEPQGPRSTDTHPPPGTSIKALKLPADGSPPSLVSLRTTTTASADGRITHDPDLTSTWGADGFQQRHYRQLELKGQRDASFNGTWYFVRCRDGSRLPSNQHHSGAFGDVFVVRMEPTERGDGEGGGALYADVPENWGECEGLARAFVLSMPF